MNGVLQKFAVSAYCMLCGAMLNIAYVLYLLIKHRSFGVFLQAPQREFYLSFIIGIHLLLSALLLTMLTFSTICVRIRSWKCLLRVPQKRSL